MKIIKIILALVVIVISIYGLVTKDFSYGALSSLMVGLFFVIIGVEELKKKGKNSWGMFLLPMSLLIIAMALFSF